MIPKGYKLSQVLSLIRKDLTVAEDHSIVLSVKSKYLKPGIPLLTLEMLIDEVYSKFVDDDGFLYFTYSEMIALG